MRFYLSVRLRCANPRHVFPYCQHFFHLLCAFRIWVIGNITYREAPRTCRARVFIHSRSNLYSINGRMYALRRVWMRKPVTIRHGSAYETELETFPSRNISGSFKSYLGFYTRGKWCWKRATIPYALLQWLLRPSCLPIPSFQHVKQFSAMLGTL